jgi:hypothetical protein
MPFVTFTVRRGLSAADKSRLSEAMLEAQVAAGYHQADRFHRFFEVDQDDLLADPRFPDYATDRTDRFMVVEVVISSGRPTGTAATMRGDRGCLSRRSASGSWRQRKSIGRGTSQKRAGRDACLEDNAELASLAGYAGV